MKTMKFITPEEISDATGGIIPVSTIKRLARERRVEHIRLPSNRRILFTEEQAAKIPALLTETVAPKPAPRSAESAAGEGNVVGLERTVFEQPAHDPFGGTARSQRAHARKRA